MAMKQGRRFRDRDDAARQLAQPLHRYRGARPLVLAIPRGAVPMGQRIACELQGELDVVLVRKLGAPFSDEYAIGAVDESGWVYRSPLAAAAGASEAYIEQETRRQMALLHQRRERYTPLRPRVDPAGRTVIVVDDGLATGATMRVAVEALRKRGVARVVVAVPVAAPDVCSALGEVADVAFCLETPRNFAAVGRWYRDFPQTSDAEVQRLLEASPSHG